MKNERFKPGDLVRKIGRTKEGKVLGVSKEHALVEFEDKIGRIYTTFTLDELEKVKGVGTDSSAW